MRQFLLFFILRIFHFLFSSLKSSDFILFPLFFFTFSLYCFAFRLLCLSWFGLVRPSRFLSGCTLEDDFYVYWLFSDARPMFLPSLRLVAFHDGWSARNGYSVASCSFWSF